MLLELARWDKDAVSAVYCHRDKATPKPVVYVKKESDPTGVIHHSILSIPHGLFRVDAFGFGAVLIKRDVFERVPRPWFKGHEGGEDIGFCRKAREHGIELWCDGRYWLAHLGDPEIFTIESFENWIKSQNMNEIGAEIKMEVQRK
jgi:hypothetical protein